MNPDEDECVLISDDRGDATDLSSADACVTACDEDTDIDVVDVDSANDDTVTVETTGDVAHSDISTWVQDSSSEVTGNTFLCGAEWQ